MKQRVGIVGHRGYSGAELIRILHHHPHTEPVLLEHREDPGAAGALRNRAPRLSIPCTGEAVREEGLSAVFLATPPEVSMELAPVMLQAGARVIDLSGAFRLGTPANYTAWYKEPHTQPELLAEAVYGLPEFCRSRIPAARLLSNPGCYPTAANLALAPLLEAGVIDRFGGIVCDAKSGVSGAGRKPGLKNSFCEVTENFSAYSILKHRHVPEVLMISGLEEREFSFTAQLIPIDRGILETIYFRTSAASAEDLLAIYEKHYAAEPFVRLYNPGHVPDLHSVARTNFCDIGVTLDPKTGRAVVVSAIDNLVKGAAGQAVQNMNLMLGFAETEGLLLKLLVKLGGTLLDEPRSRDSLAAQIAAARAAGHELVVVHGGGKQMTRYLAERGIESRFVNGLRVTTPEALDAVLKVFAGTINHELVAAVNRAGALAVGLSGIDSFLTEAEPMDAALGAVGRVTRSNPALLHLLAANDYVPVVACVAGDRQGQIFNVNADQMAVACATAFGADQLIFLTDVEGVMDASKQVRGVLTAAESQALIAEGVATGGMQAKLNAALAALAGGVASVRIAPGAAPRILERVLAGENAGTKMVTA